MADDPNAATVPTVPLDNWVPPWATQPTSPPTLGAPADAPPVPLPADPTATDRTLAAPPAPAPDQPAAANTSPPSDAPYAGATGTPPAAPYALPPNLQPPAPAMPGGPPGLQDLGQPATAPPQVPPAVSDNRLAGLLPPDQMHALALATDKTADPAVRAQAWNALPANIRTETVLHAQGDQLDSLGGIYEHLSPQEQVAWQVANNNSEQMRSNAAIAKATADYQSGIEQNHRWVVEQHQKIAAQTDANNARAQQLANTQVGVQFSPLAKAGIVLGSILGGVSSMNGQNSFVDSLNKNIERQVADQKFNLENKWKGLNESNNVLAQEWQRTGDQAQAEYTYRQAAYGAALNTIKTEAQNYIPGGTTHAKLVAAYGATVAQMNQTQAAYQLQQQESVAKVAKARGDAMEAVAKGRIEAIKGGVKPEAFVPKEWLNPMGAGPSTGGPYSPKTKYTFDQFQQLHPGAQMPDKKLFTKGGAFANGISETDWEGWSKSDATNNPTSVGLLNPFTRQPIDLSPEAKAGNVKLKDENRTDIKTKIDGYADAQNAWAELDAVGARIQYHRSLGGQIAQRFAGTEEREYDAKRKALITKMTKQLGERPNEQSMKNLADMVPELASMGTEANIGKMIHDAQSSVDRDFATQLNTAGVDGDSVIKGAQAMRKPPAVPRVDDQITAANEALGKAQTPSEKADAQQAVDDAKDRAASEAQTEQQGKQAEALAFLATPIPLVQAPPDATPERLGDAKVTNDARDTYNQALRQFHDVATAKSVDPKKLRAKAVELSRAKQALEIQPKSERQEIEESIRDIRAQLQAQGWNQQQSDEYIARHFGARLVK